MTKSDLEIALKQATEQCARYRSVVVEMRNKTHEFIGKGSTWNNAYLIQHLTETLERNKP